jgi:hypothetical protein
MHRGRSRLLVALALVFLFACPHHPPNYPTGAIELHYYADGPWMPVAFSQSTVPCDSQGNLCDFFYPANLGAHGFKHPILTWGNGSFGKPKGAEYFLRHMASWGFFIVATEDSMTGPGQTILDAAKFAVAANSDSNSPFFQKLDVNHIGSFGHSQGATGAINALIKSNGLITTAMVTEIPAQIWGNPTNFFNPVNITGSVFFVDGSNDFVSPPTQGNNVTGLQSIQAFYDAVPNTVAKLKGTLVGPSHNDIGGQPDCSRAPVPCINGVYGYLGYPTAWFMDRLQGDTYAHGAFVNSTGEIFSEITNWENVASNIQ